MRKAISVEDLTPQSKRAILSRLAGGYKMRTICSEFGISATVVVQVQEWAKRLNRDDAEVSETQERKSQFIPTEEEIAEGCADIQAGCSWRERRRRDVRAGGRVEIDFIRVGAQRHAKHGGDR